MNRQGGRQTPRAASAGPTGPHQPGPVRAQVKHVEPVDTAGKPCHGNRDLTGTPT
ncbi:hypothetical protein SFR_4102 [Streptomyces sp. FR-008]|nr:hypothetical protein SFR_4102 [Streptomyces sp. FR-008]